MRKLNAMLTPLITSMNEEKKSTPVPLVRKINLISDFEQEM